MLGSKYFTQIYLKKAQKPLEIPKTTKYVIKKTENKHKRVIKGFCLVSIYTLTQNRKQEKRKKMSRQENKGVGRNRKETEEKRWGKK